MITKRSEADTGYLCMQCKHSVTKPFGARRDEYFVCGECVSEHPSVVKPEPEPDLSDSFWRIVTQP